MTRYLYEGGAVVSQAGVPLVSASATVYSLRTGGSIVTDILSTGGTPLAGVVTTDAYGQVLFQGPDSTATTYWLQFASGPRWPVSVATAPGDEDAAASVKTTATPKAAIHYGNLETQAVATSLDSIVVPKYASSAARDTANPTPTVGDLHTRSDKRGNLFVRDTTGTARWRDAGTVIVADTSDRTAQFPAPQNGDACYQVDIAAQVRYHSPSSSWVVTTGPRAGLKVASAAALATANPTPADGDRAYRTDIHADVVYNSARSKYDPYRTLIEEKVISSSVASVSFASIPQDFRHLSLEIVTLTSVSAGSDFILVTLNSDTGTNYSTLVMYAYSSPGTFAKAGSNAEPYVVIAPVGTGQASAVCKVLDYASTSSWKGCHAQGVHSSGTTTTHGMSTTSGMWKSTSAVTSLQVKALGNMTAGRLLLYGER
ncbi:hypothetical protein ACIBSV_46695 [Embleya sp. NPDC050154]|uniref:hypothetical protein n=1 Tax=Embleya sp. NPDC050154 TaxID=3363988 RepID=UPI0037B2FF9F